MRLGNEIVEGNISKDTIFNGLIKTYDTSGKILLYTDWYRNDTLNGESNRFYSNGNAFARSTYVNGLRNGYEYLYDSSGHLHHKQFFYYDVAVGPILEYRDGKPFIYRYYSFDNNYLFKLDYDSIKTGIDFLQKELFFVTKSYVTDPLNNITSSQFFIYVINPPNLNFQYSFCVVNESNELIKMIREIDSTKLWDIFQINDNQKGKDQFFAFKLDIFRENELFMTKIFRNPD